jgi:hypothetical protein
MIGAALKQIRLELKFKTSKAFHDWIVEKTNLQCNYSYYSRIEADKVVPSHLVINDIAAILPPPLGDKLILEYCKLIFPKRKKIFGDADSRLMRRKPEKEISKGAPPSSAARELTLKQVFAVSRSFEHYLVFLSLMMARWPVEKSKLEKIYAFADFNSILSELSEAKIVYIDHERLHLTNSELKFPPPHGPQLKDLYQTLRMWEQQLPLHLGFDTRVDKFFFRRVSSKYLSNLEKHLELLQDTIKIADEADLSLNEEVVCLSLGMSRGRLPG